MDMRSERNTFTKSHLLLSAGILRDDAISLNVQTKIRAHSYYVPFAKKSVKQRANAARKSLCSTFI